MTAGDIEGNFTFISTVGESVNDFCWISQDLLQNVIRFQVESENWSDHMPIVLSLKYYTNVSKKCNLLPKLIWKDVFLPLYQENQESILVNDILAYMIFQ